MLAENHLVPDDFATIQEAINAAIDFDTITVSPGIYYENINFQGKALTVTSTDPSDSDIVETTILDGSNPSDPNFAGLALFVNNEDASSILTGFTLQNGSGQSDFSIDWRSIFDGANGDGGAVLCIGSSPTITKNIFRNNTSLYGGGAIFCHNQASPLISRNTFINNSTVFYGGAIFCRVQCSPAITDNTFKINQCNALGGAIYLADNSHAAVERNSFEENVCKNLVGGAIYYFVNSHPLIANNVFWKNRAWSGGSAIAVEASSNGQIINNTIVENEIINPNAFASTLFIRTTPLVANNIIANNDGYGLYTSSTGAPIMRSNDLWNNSLGNFLGNLPDQTGLDGNISVDPFMGAVLPDPFTAFELLPDSPCRDSGDETDLPENFSMDIDGTPRIVNRSIDMGAQEFKAIAVPQDYATIQSAINEAISGDEILVDKGLYQENLDFMGKNLILRSYNPLDPNCVENTIIDGDQLASCITLNSGEDKSAVIAGFNIQNGFAEGSIADRDETIYGGGIYVADYAGATILYNYIHHNSSRSYGGGIDTRHYTDTEIAFNRIEYNNSLERLGGGVHVGHDAKVLIYKNTIEYNWTGPNSQGGGIYVFNTSVVDIIENKISYNSSTVGGGIYYWEANGRIDGNIIIDNIASGPGGGIGLNQFPRNGPHDLHVTNNIISGNECGTDGGAIYIIQGDPNIVNNTIIGNKAPAGKGAGITAGYNADPLIQNNLICHNRPGHGIEAIVTSNPDIYSYPDLRANNVWHNGPTGQENYGGTLTDPNGSDDNISADPVLVETGSWDGNGTENQTDDSWIDGDYRLGWFSPCRDAGVHNNLTPPQDILKTMRPSFSGVDIGAYELQTRDLTANGSVDITDFLFFNQFWLSQEPGLSIDFNADDIVNYIDFSTLADDYLLE